MTAVYYRALRTSSAHCSGFNSSSPMVCSLSSQPFSSPYLLRISFLTGFLEGPQIPAKCSCEHTNMLPFSLVTNSKAVWFNSSDKRSTLSSMVGDCISYRSAYGSNRYWAAVPCLYAGQDRRSMGPPETIGDRKISCSVRSITESNTASAEGLHPGGPTAPRERWVQQAGFSFQVQRRPPGLLKAAAAEAALGLKSGRENTTYACGVLPCFPGTCAVTFGNKS